MKCRRLINQIIFSWMRIKLDFTEIELRALQALKAFRAAKKEKLKNSYGTYTTKTNYLFGYYVEAFGVRSLRICLTLVIQF